jgi:AraC family transcriptional regulator, positive regulator of tynA and feaB
MTSRISPSQLPVEQFVSDLHRVCGLFDVARAEDRNLMRGGLWLEHRAGLEAALVATDVQRITRTSKAIRQDSGENYFLILQEEGRALMRQNDTTCLLRPGDFVLIDSAVPSEFVFFGDFNRQLSLHLPRAEMHARFGYDLIRGGIALPRQDPATMGIAAVISKVLTRDTSTSVTEGFLREALFGLLGAMLHERSSHEDYKGVESDISGARALAAGQAYIDAHYCRPDLSIQDMADDLGLSMRQIQRGFAALGTTPTRYLLLKRLEHARRALDDRQAGKRSDLISSIAYEAGFSDLSYFHRCYRRAFGASPKGVSRCSDPASGGSD